MDKDLIGRFKTAKDISDGDLKELLVTDLYDEELFGAADAVRRENYGDEVYLRGLIEFTNYCKNNCYYCGIRRDNRQAQRYRLTKEEILERCALGAEIGYHTFVLQGGEDPFFTDERVCDIVSSIKEKHPDCAVTLSIGEKPKESYRAYFEAGADRYLLRHEAACEELYSKLHPKEQRLDVRKRCLYDLKEVGFQVGAGFMVEAPFQTVDNIIEDLRFMQELVPDMIGIGPFITHAQTPFADKRSGGLDLTVRLLAVIRLMFPHVLLPATTALGTIDPHGREKGLKAGANVIMPNLSPDSVKKKYSLYDNKISSGSEAAEHLEEIKRMVSDAGYRVVMTRGDVRKKS